MKISVVENDKGIVEFFHSLSIIRCFTLKTKDVGIGEEGLKQMNFFRTNRGEETYRKESKQYRDISEVVELRLDVPPKTDSI